MQNLNFRFQSNQTRTDSENSAHFLTVSLTNQTWFCLENDTEHNVAAVYCTAHHRILPEIFKWKTTGYLCHSWDCRSHQVSASLALSAGELCDQTCLSVRSATSRKHLSKLLTCLTPYVPALAQYSKTRFQMMVPLPSPDVTKIWLI